MSINLTADFTVNRENNTITVKRQFNAEVPMVWDAFTKSEILDQWWAPKPWKARTKSMDFREGGKWVYAMTGPNGEEHWNEICYKTIIPQEKYTAKDAFTDPDGNILKDMPTANWETDFSSAGNGTQVVVKIAYDRLSDLEAIMNMGFKEGFTMAMTNLDQYIEAKFKLRTELKTSNMARVTTYLNFPGNTEEAFNFYKKVFGTEFSGKGIQRFGDIPDEPGNPPVMDAVKKMVLHVELPITGGHVLMATDAPKEMGFSLTQGNNMHICVEPETREETKRIFDALSNGGTVIMPLTDMFFGAYFGQCTDRFGINWMLNFVNR